MPAEKPSEGEDEYFARQEFARKKEVAEKQQEEFTDKERQRLIDLHSMRCPKCGMELAEVPYKLMKIEKCTHCEGVWLDKGELEQLTKDADPDMLERLFGMFR